MSTVTLEHITRDNVRKIIRLETTPEQTRFVAPNAVSLAEACVADTAWYRAIYADGEPVGFVMLNIDDDGYFLWRFMLAAEHQRKGYGRAAIALLVEQLRAWGASTLLTSYVPGEGSPGPFYVGVGFEETGHVEEGERVLRLAIAPLEHPPPDQ